jgi:hypothetical protein
VFFRSDDSVTLLPLTPSVSVKSGAMFFSSSVPRM